MTQHRFRAWWLVPGLLIVLGDGDLARGDDPPPPRAEAKPEPTSDDNQAIQGTWQCVRMSIVGIDQPISYYPLDDPIYAPLLQGQTWMRQGVAGKPPEPWADFQVWPDKLTKEIEIRSAGRLNSRGTYELAGDTLTLRLTIAAGSLFPPERFVVQAPAGDLLLVYQRSPSTTKLDLARLRLARRLPDLLATDLDRLTMPELKQLADIYKKAFDTAHETQQRATQQATAAAKSGKVVKYNFGLFTITTTGGDPFAASSMTTLNELTRLHHNCTLVNTTIINRVLAGEEK